MNSQVELDKIISAISSAKRIGIFTHESPDGDAIGSSMALYLGLKQLKKDVDVITGEYSKSFSFLSCLDEIKNEGTMDYDLCVALDCADKRRLYDLNNSYDMAGVTISIDHHASNTYYATFKKTWC